MAENNRGFIAGEIMSQPELTHEMYNEGFYEFKVRVNRLSESYDEIPVTISERVLPQLQIKVGANIACKGQFRSHNIQEDGKSRLLLTMFVREVVPYDEQENPNMIELIGYICKPPIYRTTPFKREICDMLLAVNRNYNKSDYIPCITWGRNARFVNELNVGEKIKITGRIQSRSYQKVDESGKPQNRTAYEVSVVSVERVPIEIFDQVDIQESSLGKIDNYYPNTSRR